MMTDFSRDLIMGGSPSLPGFTTTDIGIAAARAIEQRVSLTRANHPSQS
jgi:hypothetical protein